MASDPRELSGADNVPPARFQRVPVHGGYTEQRVPWTTSETVIGTNAGFVPIRGGVIPRILGEIDQDSRFRVALGIDSIVIQWAASRESVASKREKRLNTILLAHDAWQIDTIGFWCRRRV